MGLVNKKRKHNGVHGYAYLISGLVSVSLLYTLFGGDSDADAKIKQTASLEDQYSASAILSNDFNYGFGKTPKPDAYAPEVRISSPQWLSLENPANTIATAPMAEPEEAEQAEVLLTPITVAHSRQDNRPRQ
ncbi:MAG: hypothetical protein KAR62_07620, partial [Sphingomonadales bacterium]|nr:hypothetical protein [Sphingomonadales bacterium]